MRVSSSFFILGLVLAVRVAAIPIPSEGGPSRNPPTGLGDIINPEDNSDNSGDDSRGELPAYGPIDQRRRGDYLPGGRYNSAPAGRSERDRLQNHQPNVRIPTWSSRRRRNPGNGQNSQTPEQQPPAPADARSSTWRRMFSGRRSATVNVLPQSQQSTLDGERLDRASLTLIRGIRRQASDGRKEVRANQHRPPYSEYPNNAQAPAQAPREGINIPHGVNYFTPPQPIRRPGEPSPPPAYSSSSDERQQQDSSGSELSAPNSHSQQQPPPGGQNPNTQHPN